MSVFLRVAMMVAVVLVLDCTAVGCQPSQASIPSSPVTVAAGPTAVPPSVATQAPVVPSPSAAALSPTARPSVAPLPSATARPTARAVAPSSSAAVPRGTPVMQPPEFSQEPTVVVTGEVGEVGSDGYIKFSQQVHGFEGARLLPESDIVTSLGAKGTRADIGPGAIVQVAGWPDGSAGVWVKQLRIVSTGTPSPVATAAPGR